MVTASPQGEAMGGHGNPPLQLFIDYLYLPHFSLSVPCVRVFEYIH